MTSLCFLPEQIEQWPAARLKPCAKNARTHSDDQIAKIAASLVEHGWTAPVMVADDGEIVAGHGRLLAPLDDKDWGNSYGITWDDSSQGPEPYEGFIKAAVENAILPNAAWYCWCASRRRQSTSADPCTEG
jgi:hypothetical protein